MRLIGGIKKYAPTGWQFTLIVNFSKGEHFEHIPAGVECIVLGDLTGQYLIRALRNQAKIIQPDVVICCMGRQLLQWWFSTRWLTCKNKVIVIQAVPVKLAAYSTLKNHIRTAFMAWLYPKANAVVCVSDAVKTSVQSLNGKLYKLASRIYNPVFDNSMLTLAEVESSVFGGYSGFNAVAVGRLNVQKDYGTMIRAVALVLQQRPDFYLHILGGGELLPSFTTLAKKLDIADRIIFHGYVQNPYPYLAQANLFVMSSLWEGLPNAMVEALALGKPVVSTNCIAGPAEILDNGRYGQLTELNSPQAFAKAIEQEIAIERNTQELCARGQYYSVENSSRAYITLIGELTS